MMAKVSFAKSKLRFAGRSTAGEGSKLRSGPDEFDVATAPVSALMLTEALTAGFCHVAGAANDRATPRRELAVLVNALRAIVDPGLSRSRLSRRRHDEAKPTSLA